MPSVEIYCGLFLRFNEAEVVLQSNELALHPFLFLQNHFLRLPFSRAMIPTQFEQDLIASFEVGDFFPTDFFRWEEPVFVWVLIIFDESIPAVMDPHNFAFMHFILSGAP